MSKHSWKLPKDAKFIAEIAGKTIHGECKFQIGSPVVVKSVSHPADTFDQMTELGYKLNLVTGEYCRTPR